MKNIEESGASCQLAPPHSFSVVSANHTNILEKSHRLCGKKGLFCDSLLEPQYAHCENENAEPEQGRTFHPQFPKADPFEKNPANDDKKISQGDEVGEELNDCRHVLNGKDEPGEKHHW